MKHTPSNEAAFPRAYSEQQPGDSVEYMYAQDGMTMREWYAGKAMAAMIASKFSIEEIDGMSVVESLAAVAFRYADAMLAEAKRGPR